MPFYQLSCRPVQLHRRPFQCMRLLPKNQPDGHTVPGSGGSCLLHKATSRIVGYSIVLTSMPVLHGNAVLRLLPGGSLPGGDTQRIEPGKHAAQDDVAEDG